MTSLSSCSAFSDFHMFPQRAFYPEAAQFFLQMLIDVNVQSGKYPRGVFTRKLFDVK